jgi:glycerate dehydrogenase
VAAREPIPKDSPLLDAPNCVITPHMAWSPKESRQRILDTTADSIWGFLHGHAVNTVNQF